MTPSKGALQVFGEFRATSSQLLTAKVLIESQNSMLVRQIYEWIDRQFRPSNRYEMITDLIQFGIVHLRSGSQTYSLFVTP
jgi:hypothetical protein